MEGMDEFIVELLRESGLSEKTDPGVRARLVQDLGSRASDFINRGIIDAMSMPDALAFERLLDEQPDNLVAMQQFVDQHVPNMQAVVGAALLEFRSLYLG
jgi:hypothetical protein